MMHYNFYQSLLRQYINREIYRKPVGVITLAGQDYQYIIKRKSVLGVVVNWYQILGIELPLKYLTDSEQFRESVMVKCRTQFASQGDCFVQLGIINQLGITDTSETKLELYNIQWNARRRQYSSAMMSLG